MHRLRTLSLAAALILFQSVVAQQSSVTFVTTPYNSKLTLDGEEIGDANNRKVRIGFNEQKGLVEHVFLVRAAGYDDQQVVIDMETPANKTIVIELERSLPSFDFDTSLTFGFDKVVSAIPYSTNVGNNTKWKYRYDEEILIGEARKTIVNAMEKMDFPKPEANANGESSMPKIIVVGQVEKLEIKRGRALDNYAPFSSYYSVLPTIKWSFVTSDTKDTVMSESSSSVHEFVNVSKVTDEFYAAISNNFINFFATDRSIEKQLHKFEEEIERREEERKAEERRIAAERQQEMLDSIAQVAADTALNAELEVDSADVAIAEKGESTLLKRVTAFDGLNALEINALAKRSAVSVFLAGESRIRGGAVVGSDGYIVTSYVGDDAQGLEVQFSNGIVLDATVIRGSERHDLSLIKVEANGLLALPILEDISTIRQGARVTMWMTAPKEVLDLQSVGSGLLGRRKWRGVQQWLTTLPASDASSGAALIDESGQLIGIVHLQEGSREEVVHATDARYLYHVLGVTYE